MVFIELTSARGNGGKVLVNPLKIACVELPDPDVTGAGACVRFAFDHVYVTETCEEIKKILETAWDK